MRWHAFILLLAAGVIMKIKGKENIPATGSFIICPNHTSFLDILCLYNIFSRYFVFTGKQEIEKWPLFHIFYTSGMNILVDRHSRIGSLKALKRMSKEIELGNPLMIFPEGTISNQVPKLSPFKSGAFALAIQKQVPVLPITFISNWKLMQRSSFLNSKSRPGIAYIVIHKPELTTGLNKEDILSLQNQVYTIIREPLI
jgi:1-acyl-sn-glycerol-3-phosphate acyltransferase